MLCQIRGGQRYAILRQISWRSTNLPEARAQWPGNQSAIRQVAESDSGLYTFLGEVNDPVGES